MEKYESYDGYFRDLRDRNASGEGHLKEKIPPRYRSEYECSRIDVVSVSIVKWCIQSLIVCNCHT
jgi:hypothetical protein